MQPGLEDKLNRSQIHEPLDLPPLDTELGETSQPVHICNSITDNVGETIQPVHIGNGITDNVGEISQPVHTGNCITSDVDEVSKPKHQQSHNGGLEQLSMKKNADGTWGPTGLYGGRLKETKLLTALRLAVKPSRLKRVEQVLQNRCQRVQCLFENLNDPANGAACLRTMEGFGILVAHAVEAYEPFHVTGGITMHAEKWMQVHKYKHCEDAATELKKRGFTLIATCLDKDAKPVLDVDYTKMEKVCVMFGNEERGLSRALRDMADVKVYIPMAGFTQSFNISVSCAMMLFHLRERGVIKPDLDDGTLNEIYLKWLLMSTKKAANILKKRGLEDEVPDFV